MGIAARTLKENGQREQAREMQKRVTQSGSYREALGIIMEYVEPVSEDYYADVGFTKEDHVRLRDSLMSIDGKFLLSYNDCPEIRQLWDKPGIMIESIERLNNLAQRYDGGCMYGELLISNYDTGESKNKFRQMSFLDDDYFTFTGGTENERSNF